MARRLKLGQLLISKGLLTPEQLASALAEQEGGSGRLGSTLVQMGYIDEELLVKVLSQQLQLPVARIGGKRVKADILERVPAELAEKYRCLPLFTRDEGGQEVLFVGMDDPSDLAAIDELAFRIEETVKAVLVAPTELDDALQRNYHEPGRRRSVGPTGTDDGAPGLDALAGGESEGSLGPVGTSPCSREPDRQRERDTATEPLIDARASLPPVDPSSSARDAPEPVDGPAATDRRLPPMGSTPAEADDSAFGTRAEDPEGAGLVDTPSLGGSSGDPQPGTAEVDPVLGGLADDPAFGGPEGDPVPCAGILDDSGSMSFSAADEEPVADLANAPFGDSDPDLGSFVGGPFGSSHGDELESFAGGLGGEAPSARSGPGAEQTAASASLEADVVIKALAQLLVEKGVIGRDEFAERLRRLAAGPCSPD